MGIGKKIKKSILLYTAVFAVFFILVSVVLDYYGLKFLDWVIYLSGGFVAIGVIGGTIQILVHAGRKKRGLPLAISIVFLVLEIAASLLAAAGIFLLADRQEVTERDGRIMVKETHSFLFSNWIAYYDYRNPLVMGKQVRIYEAYEDSLAEYLGTYYFDQEGNQVGSDTARDDRQEDIAADTENPADDSRKEQSAEAETETAYPGYLAIYEAVFQNQGDSFEPYYNAKGSLCVQLYEDDESVRFLIYDRDSQNGACAIYVYYESEKAEDGSWSPGDAVILDMYAYVYDTGEVIDSGRKAWSDVGSSEYREATGE